MKSLMAGSLLLLTVACLPQPSIQPLFGKDESLVVPGLAGDWVDENGDEAEVLRLSLRDDKTYRLTLLKDGANEDVFEVRVARIGDDLFWDLKAKSKGDSDEWALPLHVFARVSFEESKLSFAYLDDDWMTRALKEGRLAIDHAKTEDGLVLTAPTAELQRLIASLRGEEGAFSGPDALVRRPVE